MEKNGEITRWEWRKVEERVGRGGEGRGAVAGGGSPQHSQRTAVAAWLSVGSAAPPLARPPVPRGKSSAASRRAGERVSAARAGQRQ